MKRVLKWIGRLVAGLVLLVLLAVGVIYVLSQRTIGQTFEVEGVAVELPTDAAAIEEGRRLAIVRGCYDGCHGPGFGGNAFFDEPFPFNVLFGRMNAPDLTALAATRSDAEMERSIRRGVKPDRRSVIAMPSESFALLSDEDLGMILAAIRAADPAAGPGSYIRLGPLARYFLYKGDFAIAAEGVDHAVTPPVRTPSDTLEWGEYLARTVCSECHGADLLGSEAFGPSPGFPPLSVVVGYTPEQFTTLMREGVPASGLELNLMREVALNRFSRMTDEEVAALYGFLNDPATWQGGATTDQ